MLWSSSTRKSSLDHRDAHTANMSENGLPGARHLAYYEVRARGDAGMIVVEPIPVHRTGVLTRGNFLHETYGVIPAFRKPTDACHQHDTEKIHQLYHISAHGDLRSKGARSSDLSDYSPERS